MNCRNAVYPDLMKIAELERECLPQPWNHKMLSDSFLGGAFTAFVLEEGGEIVGYAGMTAVYEDGDLERLCVLPSHRRKGGATLLLQAIFRRAEELNLGKLFLEVRATNAPAIGLYESCGFTPLSVRKGYYESGEDAVVYCKTWSVD